MLTIDKTTRTNETPTGYDFGGVTYKKESRLDAQGNPYTVDVAQTPAPAPVATPEKTAGQIYDFGAEDPLLAAALNERTQSARESGNEVIDEEQIRADKLAEMQAEIDAQNAIYADKLRVAKVQGRGRLGTSTAIQGRRGLLGSDFGNAQTDTVENSNADIENSLQNELAVKIAKITSDARTNADTEIAAKRAAKEAGLNDYLTYLQGDKTRKEENTTKVINALIAQGVDPSTMDAKSLEAVAKGYGIKASDIKTAYQLQSYTSKKAKDDAEAKRKADVEDAIAKKGVETIADGAMGYRFNRATNEYELVANNPKGSGTGAGNVLGISPEAQSWADLIMEGRATIANVPSAFRTQVAKALNATKQTEGGLAQGMYDAIVTLEGHPGFKSAVGTNALLGFGKGINGTQSAGFLKELDTLKANLKLVNIKYLKGTGAISDAEGRTLENASTSLDPSLPEAQFNRELQRVKAILLKTRGDEINQNPEYAPAKQVEYPIGSGKIYNVAPNGDMTPVE